MQKIENTELFKAMISSGRYLRDDALETIQQMRDNVADGENPEDVLNEEGFEPDYIYDIIDIGR